VTGTATGTGTGCGTGCGTGTCTEEKYKNIIHRSLLSINM